jgi:hypothetical protein
VVGCCFVVWLLFGCCLAVAWLLFVWLLFGYYSDVWDVFANCLFLLIWIDAPWDLTLIELRYTLHMCDRKS